MGRQIALVLVVLALATFASAEIPPGPDSQPLPGAPGGLAIPKPRDLQRPNIGALKKLLDRGEKDKKDHADQKSGTVQFELPGGIKVTIKWERVDETHCKHTITLTYPEATGKPPETLVFDVTHDAQGVMHWKVTLPPDTQKHYGPVYVFDGSDTGCTDLIWVQYIERKFTLYDAKGVALGTLTLGPGIDGGVPYPVQGPEEGAQVMQDAPGSFGPATSTDQQSANEDIQQLRKELNVSKDKAGTKGKRQFKFWTYLICLAPNYHVVGHFEWGFTIDSDTQNKPYVSVTGVAEPSWTPGK